MVGYVENENFNLVCAMSICFHRIARDKNDDIWMKSEWDSCTTEEYVERVREKHEDYENYIKVLKYKKLKNIYSKKIYSYFNVERNGFAKELADYLTKQESEAYIVSEYVRRVNNNDISFLLVHPENVSDFTSFEENKKIYLITAWLKNCESEQDKLVNLVNPFCSIVLNGKELYFGSKVFSWFQVFAENSFYTSLEFKSITNILQTHDFWDVEDLMNDEYEKHKNIVTFIDSVVKNLANKAKVDLSSYPQFKEEKEDGGEVFIDYRRWYKFSDRESIASELYPAVVIQDIEITYYLENKHLFE